MSKPNATELRALLRHCLFAEDELEAVETDGRRMPLHPSAEAEGITAMFCFHRGRIIERRAEIAEQLAGLPVGFRKQSGGGWSFLQACVSEDGTHWGEHANVEMLVVLGIAAGFVRYLTPRSMWDAFPGGLPYFVVDLEAVMP